MTNDAVRVRLEELIRTRSGWQGHTLERGGIERFISVISLLDNAPSSVLDVGCGTGCLVDVLNEIGHHAEGVDTDPTVMELMSGPHRVGGIEAIPWPDKAFDAVVATEVFEHLPVGVYERGLTELSRVARKRIVITVPNAESLESASTMCPACRCVYSIHGHVRRFDESRMSNLFPGFSLVHVTTTGPYKMRHRTIEWYLRRRLLGRWPRQSGVVCPQCGFRQAGERSAGITASSKFGRAIRLIAGVPWQKWCIVAAYDRVDAQPL